MKNSPFASLISVAGLVHCQPVSGGTCSKPSFAAGRVFAAGDSSWFSAVADFNGDGQPDLVVPNFASATVSVLLNTCGK
jgi:hypothetical protein